MQGAPPLIEAVGLAKHFGGIFAVDHLDFAVFEGELVGLIGPNGSGKTTTINLLSGNLGIDAGLVRVRGQVVNGLPASGFAGVGIGRTFQITQLFGRMSVLENMLVPGLARPHAVKRAVVREARQHLEFLGLASLESLAAKNLSGGQQKLLELGRALMLRPAILFLDEPFAGVNPYLRDQIIGFVKVLHEAGRTFVIVDHDLDAIQRLVRRLVVMSRGKKIADGSLATVRENRDVIKAYSGT